MFGILTSVCELVEDVVDIAVAPLEIAVDVTKAAIRPIADATTAIKDEIKDCLER